MKHPMQRIIDAGFIGATITWDANAKGWFGHILSLGGQYHNDLFMTQRYLDFEILLCELAEFAEKSQTAKKVENMDTKSKIKAMLSGMSEDQKRALAQQLGKL